MVEKWLALRAALLLTTAVVLVRLVPMRYWRARLTIAREAAPATWAGPIPGDHLELAERVCRVVRRTARNLPFPAECLPQAMVAQWILRNAGIGTQIHIGARPNPDGGAQSRLDYHAWLTLGDRVITGGQGQTGFRPFRA